MYPANLHSEMKADIQILEIGEEWVVRLLKIQFDRSKSTWRDVLAFLVSSSYFLTIDFCELPQTGVPNCNRLVRFQDERQHEWTICGKFLCYDCWIVKKTAIILFFIEYHGYFDGFSKNFHRAILFLWIIWWFFKSIELLKAQNVRNLNTVIGKV
jgi:hypothetical protein